MSLKFLINQKFFLFICNLNAKLNWLHGILLMIIKLRYLMKLYRLWRIDNVNIVISSIRRAFELNFV